jgi:thiol-disulfide isomerase/thioredoxin
MFKNNLLIGALSLLIISNVYAQDDKIAFSTNAWKDILVQAKTENKPIFVDFYAEWCGPCKMMSKQVFTDKEVANYYNANFISVKIDAEKQELELVEKTGITAYPSLYYFSPDGKVLNKQVGALKAKEFKAFGENVVNMLGIAKKLPEIKATYEKNPQDLSATANYIKALTLTNQVILADSIAKIYLPKVAEKDLQKAENWEIISRYVRDFDNREFQYVSKNAKTFLELYGEEAYGTFFYEVLNKNLEKTVKAKSLENLATIKTQFAMFNQQMGSEFTEEFHNLGLEMYYYQATGNKEKYLELMITQTDKYLLENGGELIKRIFEIIQKYDSKSALEKANTWSQKLLKNENSALSNYVCATVFFKQGNKVEAKKYLDIAISKNDNPELDQYIQALKQELGK